MNKEELLEKLREALEIAKWNDSSFRFGGGMHYEAGNNYLQLCFDGRTVFIIKEKDIEVFEFEEKC